MAGVCGVCVSERVCVTCASVAVCKSVCVHVCFSVREWRVPVCVSMCVCKRV